MRIELGTVLNVIDDVKEHLTEQDYITCMNILRDANKIILSHEERVCNLWGAYYSLRDENEFYEVLLDFIGTKPIEVPRSFDHDVNCLSNARDYLANLYDSDENDEMIDDDVILHLQNMERIKKKYEKKFIQTKHPELIDEAGEYILKHSGYEGFEFCGRLFKFKFE